MACCGLFLITQLYKHSTPTNELSESKTDDDRNYESRKLPIVLPLISDDEFHYVESAKSFFKQKHNVLQTRIDWHNYTLIEMEENRRGRKSINYWLLHKFRNVNYYRLRELLQMFRISTLDISYEFLMLNHILGPGEQGKKFKLTDPEDIKKNNELNRVNGYWAVASDLISVNRSVADIRYPLCRLISYLKELPTASIVIPFYNDHLSVLMRTVHSVINRAPSRLIKEVILVNDFSTKEELYEELKAYLAQNFEGKAHVIDLPERSGLITARLAGAKVSTGDVIIFLDSHVEANTNYLPPLLDPIAQNYRTVVCPFIDVIDAHDYEYRAQDEGNRGGFEWNFLYKRFDVRPGDQETPADIFPSPVSFLKDF